MKTPLPPYIINFEEILLDSVIEGYSDLREDNHVQTTYTQLPSSAPGFKQTAVQVNLVSRLSWISAKETAMCAISPSNRSTDWPGLARLKIYSPIVLYMYSVMLIAWQKEQSPASGGCLEHRLVKW